LPLRSSWCRSARTPPISWQTDFPYRDGEGKYPPAVVLDFDYWGIVLR
jgi:hypothetical protein